MPPVANTNVSTMRLVWREQRNWEQEQPQRKEVGYIRGLTLHSDQLLTVLQRNVIGALRQPRVIADTVTGSIVVDTCIP